eukprot:366377-Chlamydomonas_euryale.AAC.3
MTVAGGLVHPDHLLAYLCRGTLWRRAPAALSDWGWGWGGRVLSHVASAIAAAGLIPSSILFAFHSIEYEPDLSVVCTLNAEAFIAWWACKWIG